MNLDMKKWAPWNWFKKEQDAEQGAGNGARWQRRTCR